MEVCPKIVITTFAVIATFMNHTYGQNPCHKIEEAKTKLNVATQNFLNAETTHSPSGGFYKKRIVSSCKDGKCSVIRLNRFKKRQLINHPDADKEGIVKFPDIDKKLERKQINKQVHILQRLARQKQCGAKLLVHKDYPSYFLINYGNDPFKDIFRVKDGWVLSWTTKGPVGVNTIVYK